MKTLRIAQAALATILAVGINSTSFAFMAADQSSQVQMDLTKMVDSLREEIAAGETSCEDMLAKLNGVLEDIDNKLDAGVANEAEYLAARDAVSKMRYDLECLSEKLTQQLMGPGGSMPDPRMDGGMMPGPDGMMGPMGPNGGMNGPAGGRFSTGGGTGGVGGGAGGLATLAVIGGAAAAVADDNDSPGIVASVSGSASAN